MNQLSPSILAADFTKLGEQIREVEMAGANMLHIDVMDGSFVPSISFGMPVIASIRPYTKLPFDVHLMIDHPERYIETFASIGADLITVHYEACEKVEETISLIHAQGIQCGISIKPETPVSVLTGILDKIDLVLIMSVAPGFGGQKLIEGTFEKLRELTVLTKSCKKPPMIEVDGGITADNAASVLSAGANVLVAGSAIFHGSIAENVKTFRDILSK